VEIVLFTIVGISLYLFSDWALRAIEKRRGSALPNRSIIFFVIIFTLAMISFELIEVLLNDPSIVKEPS
jgi:hypothetical protein